MLTHADAESEDQHFFLLWSFSVNKGVCCLLVVRSSTMGTTENPLVKPTRDTTLLLTMTTKQQETWGEFYLWHNNNTSQPNAILLHSLGTPLRHEYSSGGIPGTQIDHQTDNQKHTQKKYVMERGFTEVIKVPSSAEQIILYIVLSAPCCSILGRSIINS